MSKVKSANPQPVIVKREMTITHADFFRLLPILLKHREFKITGKSVLIILDSGKLEIALSPEVVKNVGALMLPVTQITFSFANIPDADRGKFFRHFDRVYQKGGG